MHRALLCFVLLGSVGPAWADALDDVGARVQKIRGRMVKPPPELALADTDLKAARVHDDTATDAEARVQGLAAAAVGQRDLAWQALTAAELGPTDVPAQLALGQLAEAHKDWERARRAYANAFAAAPAEHAAGVGLCLALIASGRANEAR